MTADGQTLVWGLVGLAILLGLGWSIWSTLRARRRDDGGEGWRYNLDTAYDAKAEAKRAAEQTAPASEAAEAADDPAQVDVEPEAVPAKEPAAPTEEPAIAPVEEAVAVPEPVSESPAATASEPAPAVDPEALEAARRERFEQEKAARRAEKAAKREAREEAAEAAAAQRLDDLAEDRQRFEAERRQAFRLGLTKTREGLLGKLGGILGFGSQVTEETFADLEAVLFTSDIGVRTADRLLSTLRQQHASKAMKDQRELLSALRREIESILDLDQEPLFAGGEAGAPRVIMVVGVNGVGKTTTIGKLAHRAIAEGHQVLVGAGDTFRAAAVEQLEVWGERSGATVVSGKSQADPSSVLFSAVQKGLEQGASVIICDTAGRLHTRAELMEELKKMHRVMGKALPGAPHEVLLVLDATVGQNAIAQARSFKDAVEVTGIALTKLDGTARGGVIAGICDEMGVAVRFIGVGEALEDLRVFDAEAFVDALFADAEQMVLGGGD
ncbi:MAG: signal recognition particle-docking protein FtsY [Myxococcales bacterium]|nr:signal recognition particle-docking protein FtsY [Myxococcales bacterium]